MWWRWGATQAKDSLGESVPSSRTPKTAAGNFCRARCQGPSRFQAGLSKVSVLFTQDAFSKTLPIWAAVVNRAVAQLRGTTVDESDWDAALHLPAWVPDSEAHQIGLRLDGWAADLLHVCPDLHGLAGTLLKPLRCMWLAPDSRTWGDAMDGSLADLAFTPLILASASLSSGRQRRCLELGPTADGGEGGQGGAGRMRSFSLCCLVMFSCGPLPSRSCS